MIPVISLICLASCGGGTSSATSSTGGSGTSSSQTSTAGETETSSTLLPETNTSSNREIVFWHCLGHDKTNNLNAIVEKFNNAMEEEMGSDAYYVTLESVGGDYDSLHSTVKTKLNAGYVPSITMGYPDSFAEYIGSNGASSSRILRLDDYINQDENFDPDSFVQMYYEEGQGYQYEGTYSVPMYKSTEVMYYNIDMWESSQFYKDHKDESYGDYGAILGDPSTWDWDTLVYVAQNIQAENSGTADFHALGYDSDSNLMITQMEQRGIPYTTADISATGDSADHYLFYDYNTESPADGMYDLVNEIYSLTQSGALVTQGSYGSYASTLFLQKKVMFTIGSTGGSAYNEPSGKFEAGLAPVPAYHGNKKYIMQGPSLCFFNMSDPYLQYYAWKFYSEYLSEAQNNAELALENSYDPVRTSSYETDSYKTWCSYGLTEDGEDDTTAELQYRIPNLTSTLKDNYMKSDVFIGSSTARDEIGNIISYCQSYNGDINTAIYRAWYNCILAS